MTDTYQFNSLTVLEHLVDVLPGQWNGPMRTWFEPGVLAAEVPNRGSIRLLPGTHTLVYEYESSLGDRPFQGLALFSYNLLTGKMEAAWSDSFHMSSSLMISQGEVVEGGFSVLGSYPGPEGSPPWGWRTVLHLVDRSHVTLTAYNISPEGQEAKALETMYTRKLTPVT
jgi:hypothetical protein